MKRTGKIAHGDGHASDRRETEIVQGAEIGDGLGERRVPIYHRVLRLHRSRNVGVHAGFFCLATDPMSSSPFVFSLDGYLSITSAGPSPLILSGTEVDLPPFTRGLEMENPLTSDHSLFGPGRPKIFDLALSHTGGS